MRTQKLTETIPECNGWRNKPTWLVGLWLNNDEGSYHELRRLQRSCDTPQEFASALQSWAESDPEEGGMVPDLGASFAADLMGWALAHVDWQEIADAEWDPDLHPSEDEEEDEEDG